MFRQDVVLDLGGGEEHSDPRDDARVALGQQRLLRFEGRGLGVSTGKDDNLDHGGKSVRAIGRVVLCEGWFCR